MSRVRINGEVVKITKGAYNQLYAPLGYEDLDLKKADKVKEIDEEEEEVEEIQRPISQMSADELKEFALAHDIDTSSAATLKEAKRIVREALA